MSEKNGRGRVKSTEFDMLQKLKPISLMIKNGNCKISCDNASVFSERVAWIMKQHTDMSCEC